jgi:hypothetical protein
MPCGATFDRAHDGRKLQQHAIAGGFDNPAAVTRDDRVNGGAMLPKGERCTRLVSTHQPAIAGDICCQDSSKSAFDAALPRSGHITALLQVLYTPSLGLWMRQKWLRG